MKAAIFKCSYCKYEDAIAIRDIKRFHDVDENDIKSFPSSECHMCHKAENYPSEIREMPDDEFPEITDWDAFYNS